jgi:uncharacterized protein (DUF58 family)
LRIIQELLNFEPESKQTNIAVALEYLTNAIKKRSIGFILSDFIDTKFNDALTIANRKHDIVALRVFDQRETSIPSMGLVKMVDAETNEFKWVDTSSKAVRQGYEQWWNNHTNNIEQIFKKCGVDYASAATGEDYVKPLIYLFKHRGA